MIMDGHRISQIDGERSPKDPSIERLLQAVYAEFGQSVIRPYGTYPAEQYGTGFQIAGVQPTFSALTLDGSLPEGQYDIQIESYPPGDYLYTDIVALDQFIELVRLTSGPQAFWP
jgi:hypothetical protein